MDASKFSLAGKATIVTGAAQGIGRAIATEFARAGAHVACVDIDASRVQRVAQELEEMGVKAIGIGCDVSSEAATQAAVQQAVNAFGRLDVLAHAAAIREPSGTVLDYDLSIWNSVFAVAVGGAFLMSKWCIPHMRTAGGGSIVLIASQLGSVGSPARPAYCSSKGAIIQLAKALAVDHGKDGIRANSLSPGGVETERLTYRYGTMDEARRLSAPKYLLNRLGQPEELGRAAVFLASDASSFMTGTDLLVDGGYNAV
jgi:NAD(P)-dependent dehydrogenase (short-subunit alcohol dehydrogenase family)